MAAIASKFDLTVIGGGIIGLATARQAALRNPKLSICVLEKEKELASHQSKRNSGVVHCGIYYKKKSMKSRFCIKGAQMVKEYCQAKGLPYNQCGKLIVATKQDELETLHNLFANAKANKIDAVEMITKNQIETIQPGCTTGIEAIYSPNTAIVDWQQVARSYADDFKQMGGNVITDFIVQTFEPGANRTVLIKDLEGKRCIESKAIVCCAGVYSDFFARQTGNNEHPKVVPFRGNYCFLSDRLAKSIKTNIYPVPDPKLPFLGVHITPRLDGSVLLGPTAMLCLSYEKYDENCPTNLAHTYHILCRSGLRKMLMKKDNLKAGLLELRRFGNTDQLAKELRSFLPDLKTGDIVESKFCGIRAQCMDKDGQLIDDFIFETGRLPDYHRVLHVRNCPSPAATSSLALAEGIVNILEERMI